MRLARRPSDFPTLLMAATSTGAAGASSATGRSRWHRDPVARSAQTRVSAPRTSVSSPHEPCDLEAHATGEQITFHRKRLPTYPVPVDARIGAVDDERGDGERAPARQRGAHVEHGSSPQRPRVLPLLLCFPARDCERAVPDRTVRAVRAAPQEHQRPRRARSPLVRQPRPLHRPPPLPSTRASRRHRVRDAACSSPACATLRIRSGTISRLLRRRRRRPVGVRRQEIVLPREVCAAHAEPRLARERPLPAGLCDERGVFITLGGELRHLRRHARSAERHQHRGLLVDEMLGSTQRARLSVQRRRLDGRPAPMASTARRRTAWSLCRRSPAARHPGTGRGRQRDDGRQALLQERQHLRPGGRRKRTPSPSSTSDARPPGGAKTASLDPRAGQPGGLENAEALAPSCLIGDLGRMSAITMPSKRSPNRCAALSIASTARVSVHRGRAPVASERRQLHALLRGPLADELVVVRDVLGELREVACSRPRTARRTPRPDAGSRAGLRRAAAPARAPLAGPRPPEAGASDLGALARRRRPRRRAPTWHG